MLVGRDLGWQLARDKPVVKLDCLHYLFKVPDKDGVHLNNGVMTLVHVGREFGWLLVRNETVIKLDRLHYLFKLPDKDGVLPNYGVVEATLLPSLDVLLKSDSCLSAPSRVSRPPPSASASRVDRNNGMLAKAIAAGTSHPIKGIFMCNEAYCSPVQTALGVEAVRDDIEDEQDDDGHGHLGDRVYGCSAASFQARESPPRHRTREDVLASLDAISEYSSALETLMGPWRNEQIF
ncbi:hypothetical protein VPH35_016313 [Triticum aestivum]|uniref:Uncharacterized protein n=1 Tax=Aegilops tauschii TaxID=37682 RepID=N1QZT5_AEGTA